MEIHSRTAKIVGIVAAVAAVAAVGGAVTTSISNMNVAPTQDTEAAYSHIKAEKQREPVVTTEIETKKTDIPYETEYVDDGNLAQGATRVNQEGINGEKTEYYEVTYTDGIETGRKLVKTEITKEPVVQIIARGTYVAPAPTSTQTVSCENGTYVNSQGQTVCRPSASNTGGATAICGDGSYSYSQSRRGTCSHHGGVRQWL